MNIEGTRNSSIDFTKGILVIVMVLYHSSDYFRAGSDIYKYIWFVTGGFVFISGFIISNIYFGKYYDRLELARKLFLRGIKLFLIFVLLNVAVPLLLGGNYHKKLDANMLIENSYPVFIVGDNRMVIFRILLPIAYLLLIAGILILFLKERKGMLKGVCLVTALYGSVCYFNNPKDYNLINLAVGMWGVIIGFVSIHKINSLLKYFFIIVIIYMIYTFFISMYELYNPIYLLSIAINLALFYLIGLKWKVTNIFYDKLLMLGRYSLLSYITQIILLQIFYRISKTVSISFSVVFPSFIVVTFLVIVCIQIVELYRKRMVYVDRLYRFVFA